MKDNGAWGGVRVTATLQDAPYTGQQVYVDPYLLERNYWEYNHAREYPKTWVVNPDALEK